MITAERGVLLESRPLADDVISCRPRAGQGGEAERQETLLFPLFSYGIQTAHRTAPSWRLIKAFVRPCRVAVCGNWLHDKVFSYTFTYSERPGRDSGSPTSRVFTTPPRPFSPGGLRSDAGVESARLIRRHRRRILQRVWEFRPQDGPVLKMFECEILCICKSANFVHNAQ